ncbi:Serine/threonine-protein phosphatase 4 regulatory subunit 2 [Amphibalanus amphitrite]|uniref:Serine/threonine-protein phosphatase 4 regulatory subunit 2 n=1 Tax=Amphibalanus amphitrite TaxID=1232801 RepID=A0A6A4WCZ7_AMPAM|nr:Serine/threonine-protein phosphatase 4 regulatory subunit 2 [Amphibalanus amphitrite]KAF0299918.1 Serine/threonine-protein phosphatase 4 regulatory subunit 2 [Amphibalanus amphitrite]
MENREEVLMELTRFESCRSAPEIPPVLEAYLRHVAHTGDSLFPWPKVRPLLKRKLDVIADQYCQHCPPEKIPAMPNVDPFKFDQLRAEIHLRIDALSGTPFTIQRLCELMTEPQRYYKRTDKFMRGVEKNCAGRDHHRSHQTPAAVCDLCPPPLYADAGQRRPPPEAVNGAAGPEEEEDDAGASEGISRGAPSTSAAGRPPEPEQGQGSADETAAEADVDTDTDAGPTPMEVGPAVEEAVLSDGATPAELRTEAPTESVSATGDICSGDAELSGAGQSSDPAEKTPSVSGQPGDQSDRPPEPSDPPSQPAEVPVQVIDAPAAAEQTNPPSETSPTSEQPSVTIEQSVNPSESSVKTSDESSESPDQSCSSTDEFIPSDQPAVAADPTTGLSDQPSDLSDQPVNPSDPSTATPADQPAEGSPPPAADTTEQSEDVSLDSSNMSLDDSLCGSDAVVGSPPPATGNEPGA